MASHTTYTCDLCGSKIEKHYIDKAAFGIRIARANCAPYWDDHVDCCQRCQHVIVNAVREATARCKEAARG